MESQKITFNVKEVSVYLRVSNSSIRKLVRTRAIPFYRVLSRIFFDKEAIDLWIANQDSNLT
ncbi:MAG: helix-turn-helix domain-containing protein [Clostridia bacterium]|nr:helix-turn-helix domain-containing protein [Clostridia bacterium]